MGIWVDAKGKFLNGGRNSPDSLAAEKRSLTDLENDFFWGEKKKINPPKTLYILQS